MKREVINEIRSFVEEELGNRDRKSLAHDIDHLIFVSKGAKTGARYLSKIYGINLNDIENLASLAEIAGLLHDIKREKTNLPHAEASVKYVKEKGILDGLLNSEEAEIIYSAIQLHEKGYDEIEEECKDPYTLIVARSLIIGDKLFEGSGPRVIERRCFFVGRERVLDGDLKGMFNFPNESYLAVLGEGLKRIYGVNHAKNYERELWPIVDELHTYQYEFDAGLLGGRDEIEVVNELEKRGFSFGNVKKRVERERHYEGKYFSREEFPKISKAIKVINSLDNKERKILENDAKRLCYEIIVSPTPKDFVEMIWDLSPEGWYGKWVDGIRDYHSGKFFYEIEEKLFA